LTSSRLKPCKQSATTIARTEPEKAAASAFEVVQFDGEAESPYVGLLVVPACVAVWRWQLDEDEGRRRAPGRTSEAPPRPCSRIISARRRVTPVSSRFLFDGDGSPFLAGCNRSRRLSPISPSLGERDGSGAEEAAARTGVVGAKADVREGLCGCGSRRHTRGPAACC
jgi:hypothetical protein